MPVELELEPVPEPGRELYNQGDMWVI
jgi:hypothetical protein